MASQKHLKLPPFRLTKRCGTAVEVRSIHRGECARESRSVEPLEVKLEEGQHLPANTAVDNCSPCIEEGEPLLECDEPSLHEIQTKASVRGWSKLRKEILLTAVECSAMPEGQICILCSEEAAVFRCQQCGPSVFYCEQCYRNQHEKANYFHTPEKWEVKAI